jgi:hypothetical protein
MPRCNCGKMVKEGKELKHILETHPPANKKDYEILKEIHDNNLEESIKEEIATKQFKKEFEKWHKNLFGTKYPR